MTTTVVAGSFGGVSLIAASPAGAALDTTLYAVATNQIYTINETTGAATLLPGTLPFGTAALARQPGSNLLYFYEQGGGTQVGTYDKSNGTITTLASAGPANLVRLAFRSDGRLYGMDSGNDLYRLDPATGAAIGSPITVGGASLSGGGGDITFRPNDDAYVVVQANLYSLPSPYTTATLIGPTTGDTNAHPNLAFGSSGRLWTASSVAGTSNSNVGYLDTGSGAQTTVTTTSGLQFSDMASAPDRAPSAASTTASTAYNTPVTTDVSSLVSDPDGDPITLTNVTVSGGSTVGTGSIDTSGRAVFSPAVGFSGIATVTYTVSDGVGGTASNTITVTVGNAPPAFSSAGTNTSQTVTRGSTPTALAGGDPNSGDTVTYSMTGGALPTGVTLNSNGTFSGTAGARGSFTANVAITDNHGASTPGTLTITVPNVAPAYTGAASNTSQTVTQGNPLTSLAATDLEGDPLTYALASGTLPTGTTLNSNGSFSGTPTTPGTYTVTVNVSDGQGGTTATTLTVAVNAASAPTVGADTASTPAGAPTTTTVLANDTDPGGYPLTVTAVTQPAHGSTVLGSGGAVTYTPDAGFSGNDTYTYTVDNGHGGTSTGTVSVTVTPTAADDSATAVAATPVTVAVLGNDRGTLDPATVRVTTQPTHGTVTVLPSGDLRYTPAFGFAGADTFDYDVADAAARRASARVTVSTQPPAAPLAAALASTGVGTAAQTAHPTKPTGGAITLLDGTTPVTSLTVAGQGRYVLDAGTGVITFTPETGYAGRATPARYRVTDAYGQTAASTYTPTVNAPGGPSAAAKSSTGVGVATQRTVVTVPAGSSLTLLSTTGSPTSQLDIPGQGTYVLDPASHTITFTPVLGFTGTPTPVTYRLTDAYGTTAAATYTPYVTPPAPQAVPATGTSGPLSTSQTTVVAVPSGGAVTLIGADGRATTSVTVRGGTYTLDPATGQITFTPVNGFMGTASRVSIRVTDAYGQPVESTYTATVTGHEARPTATVSIEDLSVAGAGKSVRALCNVSIGRVGYCTVKLTAKVNGRTVVIGYGKVVVHGTGKPGPVVVPIQLNSRGRTLSMRPGGVSVVAHASTRAIGSNIVVKAVKAGHVVAPRVFVLRPVFFQTDKSVVRAADLAYLTDLRTKLAGVKTVQCFGYTDSRDTSTYNYELGLARARAVCSVLAAGKGIKSVTVSLGEARPQATNSTDKGMALNRRTEIVLVY